MTEPTDPEGANAGMATTVIQNIAGAVDASQLLAALCDGDVAPADALHDALIQLAAIGSAARLRGFCRRLQLALERGA